MYPTARLPILAPMGAIGIFGRIYGNGNRDIVSVHGKPAPYYWQYLYGYDHD